MVRSTAIAVSLMASFLALPALATESLDSLKPGTVELESAGALAFGPEGVLFVGDTAKGGVFAVDTGDRKAAGAAPELDLHGVIEKVAALLGTTPDQILINDVATNPLSHRVYLSVSRGKGPDAAPVLLRTSAAGELEEVPLAAARHAWVSLPNAPDASAVDRRGQPTRREAITDLAYLDGTLYIAGLSNEEFSSKLRVLSFPFREADPGASVEIYHGSHGRFETNSPVRTFVPYKVKNESLILAAYTCTPLVKFPVSALKPGGKVTGTTIAELGNMNRPLDMFVYGKGGKDYILMSNSSRGVMKMSTEKIAAIEPITTAQRATAGLPFETLPDLKGIQQLDRYDDTRAVVLQVGDAGSLDLKTIALP